MNTQQAKQIPLESILAYMGCKPKSQRGTDLWYYSPFRNETTASFKLNKRLNTWYDFGLGEGGTVIDFLCLYYNESIKETLARLEKSHFASSVIPLKQSSFPIRAKQKIKKSAEEKKKGLTLKQVTEIHDAGLFNYLQLRGINQTIALRYLKQIDYQYAQQSWQQSALGFKNDAGCYEIRNPKFKGFIKPVNFPTEQRSKTITSINIKDGNKLAVFEGFMDFLSFLTYFNITELQNSAVILNSVSSYADCQKFLTEHQFSKVYFFLDNDKAGEDTLKKLTHDENGNPVDFDWVDKSEKYSSYKDFNEMLISAINKKHIT